MDWSNLARHTSDNFLNLNIYVSSETNLLNAAPGVAALLANYLGSGNRNFLLGYLRFERIN